MLVVLTETYCNKVNIQITQRDDFIQTVKYLFTPQFLLRKVRNTLELLDLRGNNCCRRSVTCRSHWPRGVRRRSAAACLLGLWVRIQPGTWMSVSCKCCMLSGGGL